MHLDEFLPPLAACIVDLTLCLRRTRTLARRGGRVVAWRRVSFSVGVALLAVVQVGPLDSLADQVLVAHAVQHIVIGDLCSLLIALGLTGPVRAPLLRIRATRPIRRLAGPVTAFALWVADLYVWHLPLLSSLRSAAISSMRSSTRVWIPRRSPLWATS